MDKLAGNNVRLCHLLIFNTLINAITSCLKNSNGKELSKVVRTELTGLSPPFSRVDKRGNDRLLKDRLEGPSEGLLVALVDLELAVLFLVLDRDRFLVGV